jgi:enoyl-CoA hydratase/carnithine racemase
MASKAITVDYNGRIAIVTLNQPERLNSFNQEQFYLLGEHLREIAKHDEVTITVLIGTGRFFSSYVILVFHLILLSIWHLIND